MAILKQTRNYLLTKPFVVKTAEDNAARRIIIGNIQHQSLKDIWTGPTTNALRELHLKNKRSLHPVCGKQCSYNTNWL